MRNPAYEAVTIFSLSRHHRRIDLADPRHSVYTGEKQGAEPVYPVVSVLHPLRGADRHDNPRRLYCDKLGDLRRLRRHRRRPSGV